MLHVGKTKIGESTILKKIFSTRTDPMSLREHEKQFRMHFDRFDVGIPHIREFILTLRTFYPSQKTPMLLQTSF